jgi:hypothetical protein
LEGKTMLVVLAPLKGAGKKKEKSGQADTKADETNA